MKIETINTGFIELPNKITINVYTNGCKLRCKGCSNPQLQSFDGGTDYQVGEFISYIERYNTLTNNICWLGGDASYQESDFVLFNSKLKELGYNIILFTGRYKEDIEHLINDVDIIIDSPWEGKVISDIDTNQRIFIKDGGTWNKINYSDLEERNKKGE